MAPSVESAVQATGHSAGLDKAPHTAAKGSANAELERLVINTIRCLAGDLCQQYKGGHPGTVMGAATIGLALWKYHMRYNPSNPDWFARDRFVLSAGHACLLQYLYLHFSGYKAWTMDQVKMYHAPVASGSMAAGHPEIEYPGVEVTTGPLGQGIANAVGLAMAAKNIQATYNRDHYDVLGKNNKVWCFTGDGCLQEGVGMEAISLAGHLGLDNLILIYDCNEVTVDGTIGSCFTDKTTDKLRAQGWEVIEVEDGSNDIPAITRAFDEAKKVKGKPVCVSIKTIIGIGSRNQNTGKVHGQALGDDEVKYVKEQLGFDPNVKFHIPDQVYKYFDGCIQKGEKLEAEWNAHMKEYASAFPDVAAEFEARLRGDFMGGSGKTLDQILPTKDRLPSAPQPTRKSSGIAVQALAPSYNAFIAGSADLLESTFVNYDGQVEFQNPVSGLGDYAGRQVRYGIREHAMVAIGNGLAAFQKGMFVPIMSTFFMFWIYAAPAARMAALQGLRWIGIGTHDAIGIGEDGPTHQPVGLAALYRAMPNINLIRPADCEEVMGAWLLALSDGEKNTPSLFTLSRQPVPMLEGSRRDMVAKGAYSVWTCGGADASELVILATGAEVARAIDVAEKLQSKIKSIRVVSMPSQKHFDAQSAEYRRSVLFPTDKTLTVAFEAWASYGWAKYSHASLSMHSFGYSAPGPILYEKFGFGVDHAASKINDWYGKWRAAGRMPGVGEFDELLLADALERAKHEH